jgi:hypothetical protein
VQKALKELQPLTKIYWLRVALGIIAAFVCAGYAIVAQKPFPGDYFFLMNGITIALAIYLVSFYIIKNKFLLQVEKQSKLATTGIGIYFISWIVSWIILYTIIVVA